MELKYDKNTYASLEPIPVVVKCPGCGHRGTFDTIKDYRDQKITGLKFPITMGQRICPNPECQCHIFFVYHKENNKFITYPHLRIDFDSKSIPTKIKECLEEAIGCESIGAYIASAMMVRRTLECLCEDRGAEGKYLINKIDNLRPKLTLSEELFQGLHNLRLLGNDAAHVEAKDYEEIGKEEVNIAIKVTKEILKACYQHKNLIEELDSLKKQE